MGSNQTVKKGDKFKHVDGGGVEEVESVDGDKVSFLGGGGWLASRLLKSGTWTRVAPPGPHLFQSQIRECMMSPTEQVEADALADSIFSSAEVGDRNLLAIRILERAAQVERLEKELAAARLEGSLALCRLRKLRASIEAGSLDEVQASAARTAIATLEGDNESDLGPEAEPLATAYLAVSEELKWSQGVIRAAQASLLGGRSS
jgi:hypothetical protein